MAKERVLSIFLVFERMGFGDGFLREEAEGKGA
jgi:hypothetical protein